MGKERAQGKLHQIKIKDIPSIYETFFDRHEDLHHICEYDPNLYERRRIMYQAFQRADKLCHIIIGQPASYTPQVVDSIFLGTSEEEKRQLSIAAKLCTGRHTAGVANGVLTEVFNYDCEQAFRVMNWGDLIDGDIPTFQEVKADPVQMRLFISSPAFGSSIAGFNKAWFNYALYGDDPKPMLYSRIPTFWDINMIMNLNNVGLNIPVHLGAVSYNPEDLNKGVEVSTLRIANKNETELDREINSRTVQLRLLAAEILTTTHLSKNKPPTKRVVDSRSRRDHMPRAFVPVVHWERVYDTQTKKLSSTSYQFDQASRSELEEWLMVIGNKANPPVGMKEEKQFVHQLPLL